MFISICLIERAKEAKAREEKEQEAAIRAAKLDAERARRSTVEAKLIKARYIYIIT